MLEILKKIYEESKIIVLDMLFAGGISAVVNKFIHAAIHITVQVTATVAAGIILYILQKTVLPIIAKWMNGKIEKWFNINTKIEEKE